MKNLYIVNHFHLLSNKKYEYGVYALLLLSVVNKLKEIRLIHNTLQSTVHILHSVRVQLYKYNCTIIQFIVHARCVHRSRRACFDI